MDNQEPQPHQPADNSLRPEPGMEIVQAKEFLSENVSISGRHFIRCSFNFCNLIYSGGPVGLIECGGGHNRLVEVGPLHEALKDGSGDAIKEKMIRYWKDVRKGLNLENPSESASESQSESASES
jgi:hypothetical protein